MNSYALSTCSILTWTSEMWHRWIGRLVPEDLTIASPGIVQARIESFETIASIRWGTDEDKDDSADIILDATKLFGVPEGIWLRTAISVAHPHEARLENGKRGPILQMWNCWGCRESGSDDMVLFERPALNYIISAIHMYVREVIQCNYVTRYMVPYLCSRLKCLQLWADTEQMKAMNRNLGAGLTMRRMFQNIRTVICITTVPQAPRFVINDLELKPQPLPDVSKMEDALKTMETVIEYGFSREWVMNSDGFSLYTSDFGIKLLKLRRTWQDPVPSPPTTQLRKTKIRAVQFLADRPRFYILQCINLFIKTMRVRQRVSEEIKHALCGVALGAVRICEHGEELQTVDLEYWKGLLASFQE